MNEILQFIGFVVVVGFYITLICFWIYLLIKKAVKDGIMESQPWSIYDEQNNKVKMTLESVRPAQPNDGIRPKTDNINI